MFGVKSFCGLLWPTARLVSMHFGRQGGGRDRAHRGTQLRKALAESSDPIGIRERSHFSIAQKVAASW